LISNQNLSLAFKLFDKDCDGFITPMEIKEVLGKGTNFSDEKWKMILSEVDINGDGEISFEEFKLMMKNILK